MEGSCRDTLLRILHLAVPHYQLRADTTLTLLLLCILHLLCTQHRPADRKAVGSDH
jgi:hypothetical protein